MIVAGSQISMQAWLFSSLLAGIDNDIIVHAEVDFMNLSDEQNIRFEFQET